MGMLHRTVLVLLLLAAPAAVSAQQGGQDDKILEGADALLEEAKAAYESAQDKNLIEGFIDAGFPLPTNHTVGNVILVICLQDPGQVGDRSRGRVDVVQ